MARDTWSGLTQEQDKIWQEWENKYVPDCGKADTIGGEIVRAMDRLICRWFNDGDMVGVGYGNITCNGSYRYLSSILGNDFQSLTNLNEGDYEAELMDNHVRVFEFLNGEGNGYFTIPNRADSRESTDEDEIAERESYGYEDDYEEDY